MFGFMTAVTPRCATRRGGTTGLGYRSPKPARRSYRHSSRPAEAVIALMINRWSGEHSNVTCLWRLVAESTVRSCARHALSWIPDDYFDTLRTLPSMTAIDGGLHRRNVLRGVTA
jgi:hypothetical protein